MKAEVCWRVREDDIRIHLWDRRLNGNLKIIRETEGKGRKGEGRGGKLEATE